MSGFEIGRSQVQPPAGVVLRSLESMILKIAIGHFRSSLVPLFQNESKCETFHMKMSFACSFIFMQVKVIFIRIVSHLHLL